MKYPKLSDNQIESITNTFGHTENGLSNSEITKFLNKCDIRDMPNAQNKKTRLYNSFMEHYKTTQSTDFIYHFIQKVLDPALYISDKPTRQKFQDEINSILSFAGMKLLDNNEFATVNKAQTIDDAISRRNSLITKLEYLGTHQIVMDSCKEELLADNYFHSVLEASKSLTKRISKETKLNMDGVNLINHAFSKDNPHVILNLLITESEQNEYRGLKDMLCGIITSFRNVTAHEMKIEWAIDEGQAINKLTIISCLHKELDRCTFK